MKLKECKLGDLIEVTRGMSLPGEFYSTEGEYIRLTCGNFDYVNNSFKENKSKDDLYYVGKIKPEFIMEKGDIITPLTEQAIGLLGSTAIIPESDKYIQSQDVAKVTCKKGMIDHDFAYYLIPSKCVKDQLSAAAQQTKIRHTSPDAIKACKVFVPPLSEQNKIASVLSALDDKIALNKKMNQKLEAMAKRLYDYWFVQYDFPDKNGHPYKTTGGPMTYNPTLKREIPVGWEVKTLADFAEYVKTTTKFDKAFNYVSTDNMMPQKQGLSGEILKPASGNVLCYEKDDILISNIRPYFKKIWYADQSGTCSTDVLCIRSLNSDNSYFVYKTLWQDDFFDYVMQGAKGSKMPRGDKTRIMNYPICIAKENFEELIKKFSALVVPMQAAIQKNTKEITRLTKLRDKLLPLLMNGQVVVGKKTERLIK